MRVVDPAVTPRIAAEDAPAGEHAATDEAELAERVEGVLRTARVELACALGREEPEGPAPRVHEPDPEVLHVRAFSRTSAISVTSQSFPRTSAGSARPGRAART